MNIYTIALFLHIAGALGFFIALGLEWASLRQMMGARTVEGVREWIRFSNNAHRVGMPSMLLILISGFYMMATVWGGVAWIITALAALVLVVVLAVALTGPRVAAIRSAADAGSGVISPGLRQLLLHPLLWISVQTRGALALGIVFLMTVKPDLGGSLLTTGAAIALGLASSLPVPGRKRAHEEPAR